MREPRWYESDEPNPTWLESPRRPRALDRLMLREAWQDGRWRHGGLARELHARLLPDGVELLATRAAAGVDSASGWSMPEWKVPTASEARRAEVLDAALRGLPYPMPECSRYDLPEPPVLEGPNAQATARAPSGVGRLTIRLAPTIRVEHEGDAGVLVGFHGIERRTLSLQRGRIFHGAKGDLLGASLGGLLRAVKEGPKDELGGSRPGHRRALELLFARLGVHLGGLVRPELRSVLFRFQASLRRVLHDLLVTDGTGRLWQATRTLPGVMGLAAAVHARSPRTHALLVEGLLRGHKARPLVEEALHTLGLERQERFAAHWAWPIEVDVIDETFGRFATALREELARPELHAALVLHAPAMTPGWALLRPPPAGLTVDHLPRNRTQLWCYTTLLRLRRALASDPRVPRSRVEAATRWLARNRVLRGNDQALVEYLVRGLPLSPRSDPTLVRRRLGALTSELAAERRRTFARGANQVAAALPWEHAIRALEARASQPLAAVPLPAARQGDDWLSPILDTHDLAGEARVQEHCVATFADAAIHGDAFLYRGEVGGFRFTLELGSSAAGIVLRQLYGRRNAYPPRAVAQAVLRWISSGSLAEEEATSKPARGREPPSSGIRLEAPRRMPAGG